MNSYYLKLIAIITMLIDHAGAVLVPSNTILNLIMRCIGRLSFPIFVFLLVEGFYHTKDVKKYLMRMGVFALVSEIPFDLAFYGKVLEFNHQNIFFTLFLGLLCMYLMSEVEKRFNTIILMNLLNALITLVIGATAFVLKTDYDYRGIILIVAFYLFRKSKLLMGISLLLISGYLLGYINIFATFAIIPIAFYNGQKGKSIKYAFYIFYPAHLLILAAINLLL
ncbi:MAG: putative rane protein [Herbinix sp.]|jgi:hypothetical protein|nr:putative rane protein [Herbinix sp.]